MVPPIELIVTWFLGAILGLWLGWILAYLYYDKQMRKRDE
jgi:ABC-type xylose transport system permease subunit